jgi:hypothetical protein
MAAAEVELKIPLCPPFSKWEFSPGDSDPSLEKGEGEIFGRNESVIM